MLRYFYLLCLVIYIKECFCYDPINDGNSKFRPLGKRFKRKRDPNSGSLYTKKAHIIRRRQEYENSDNDQFAQIDVASFIQKPDPYADEELFSQPDDLNSQLIPKNNDYDLLTHLDSDFSNDENKKWKSNHNPTLFKDRMYSNMEASPLNYKNHDFQFNKFNNIFDNEMSLDNLIHNPIKKSSTQHQHKLRFPFFFHRKSNVSNVTNINDSTSKQQYAMDFSDLTGYDSIDKLLQQHTKKRANNNNVCTKCNNKKRGIGQSIIHNSRQYYQKIKGDNKNKKVTKPQVQNTSKEQVKIKAPVKLRVASDRHKQEGKKIYQKRHKKANMHKYKEKDTVRKKTLGWKECVESN